MNPFGTRAAAQDLARLLDGTLTNASAAMSSYALTAGRLRAAGVAMAPAIAPRADFRAALRTRLVAVASVQAHNATTAPVAVAKPTALEAAVSWSHSRRAQRGMGVAAGAMASVVAVAGVAVAGSQSLPGDPFYGVKKATESLELRTTSGDVAKGSKHLEFAGERLSEVRGLTLGRDAAFGPVAPGDVGALGGSVSERVRDTLAAMDAETREGSDLLTGAYRDSHDDAPLEILSTFAGRQTEDLRALLPDLPSGARDRAEASLELVSGVALQTGQLLAVGVCTGSCSPTSPSPALDPGTGNPVPQPAPSATAAPCGCEPVTEPTPTSAPSPTPASQPEPTPAPTQQAPAPSPTPSPSPAAIPVPVPTPSVPVPVPSLPVPLPTPSPSPLPLPSLPVAIPSAGLLDQPTG